MISIIFDVDDTLYDQIMPFREAAIQVFGDRCRGCIDDLYAAFRRHSDELFEASQCGEIGIEDMRACRIMGAARDCGFTISRECALLFQETYGLNQRNIRLSDTIMEILDFCKEKGVKMGILTNGPSAHQRNKIKILRTDRWIPWEYVYVSADIGVSKPDIAAFRYVEEHMVTGDDPVYMVGDSYRNDIAGAMQAEWKSIWLNHRMNQLREGEAEPDHIVESEEELREVIQKVIA